MVSPMVIRVYNQLKNIDGLDECIIATDDERIYNTAIRYNANCMMTGIHNSGTDRVAEVASKIDCDYVINVQGDEPLISEDNIKQLINLANNNQMNVGTLVKKIENEIEINDKNIVKVVIGKNKNALYFSRNQIPYPRNLVSNYYKHIGIYIYNKDFLLKLSKMEQTELEIAESLEQLRILENGYRISTAETLIETIGVDTPEDISKVEKIIKELEK